VAVARKRETPDQRMKRQHAEQVRRAPKWDEFAVYAQKANELAAKLGIKAHEVYEEFCERSAVRHWLGETDIPTAEALAWKDVEERFIKQGVLL
jgi:hypothetical protein